MQLLLEIENPNKIAILTALLRELQFVGSIQILDAPDSAPPTPKRTREESLARIMKGHELPSFGEE